MNEIICPKCKEYFEWEEKDALVQYNDYYLVPCPSCVKLVTALRE